MTKLFYVTKLFFFSFTHCPTSAGRRTKGTVLDERAANLNSTQKYRACERNTTIAFLLCLTHLVPKKTSL